MAALVERSFHGGDGYTLRYYTMLDDNVRGQALFWIAQKARKKADADVIRTATDDPDGEVRKKAASALTDAVLAEGADRLPRPRAVGMVFDVADGVGGGEVFCGAGVGAEVSAATAVVAKAASGRSAAGSRWIMGRRDEKSERFMGRSSQRRRRIVREFAGKTRSKHAPTADSSVTGCTAGGWPSSWTRSASAPASTVATRRRWPAGA